MKQALLVIDIQNDYFESGKHPLNNSLQTLNNGMEAIKDYKKNGALIIIIQHFNTRKLGSPFLTEGTDGVLNHPTITTFLDNDSNAVLVKKTKRNSFIDTDLEAILKKNEITDLIVCGMKTDWCITCTSTEALNRGYSVQVIENACTTVSQTLHDEFIKKLSDLGVEII